MRRLALVLGCWLALAPWARAEDPRTPPPRPDELASKAMKAFEAKDAAALAAIAKKAGFLTWAVADELIAQGHAEAARALAATFEDPSRAALDAYLERESALEPDRAGRAALRSATLALRSGDPKAALGFLESVEGRGITGLQLMGCRGVLLARTGRLAEGSQVMVASARAAVALGWHANAVRGFAQAASIAAQVGDEVAIQAIQREAIDAARKAGDDTALCALLIDLGTSLVFAGEGAEGSKLLLEGVDLARRIGHRQFLANGLVSVGQYLTMTGEYDRAKAALDEGLALQQEVGNPVYADRARAAIAALERRRGNAATAVALLEQVATAQEKRHDLGGAAAVIEELIDLAAEASDWDRVRSLAQRELALAKGPRMADHRVIATGALGRAEAGLGHAGEARRAEEEAVSEARLLQRPRVVAGALRRQATVLLELADYVPAEAAARESIAVLEKLGDRAGRAQSQTVLGNVLGRIGDGDGSLAAHREAYAYYASLGPSPDLAVTVGNLGYAHMARGNSGEALAWTVRARELWVRLGVPARAAQSLSNVAALYLRIGDLDRARETLEKAAKEAGDVGDLGTRAAALVNLGGVAATPDDPAKGRAMLEEGLALARTSGTRLWELNALASLASLDQASGNLDAARARYREVLTLSGTMRVPKERTCAYANLAAVELKANDPKAALEAAEAAVAAAKETDDPWERAVGEVAVARSLAALDRPAEALAHARAGADALAASFLGVPATLGVSSSYLWGSVRDVGLRAARATNDPAAAFELCERSRAAQLLEWLGGREALSRVGVPPELADQERRRRATVFSAQAGVARALAGGALAEIRAARQALDEAEAAHLDAVGRIQLEVRGAAAVAFPKSVPLSELEAALSGSAAFVSYVTQDERLLALVVTRAGLRVVDLGAAEDVERSLQATLDGLADGPATGVDEGLEKARRALVDPLALPTEVREVHVAPEGRLGYVPFPALLPDRAVSFVASATAWRLLASEKTPPGEGVLALGDPAYALADAGGTRSAGGTASDARLLPLPATRAEAQAVGSVVLLGPDASETGFAQALGARRWRAVHLACHGLVDEARPMQSALALSSDTQNDGYLRVSEVYGMRIPADLVVLSACESGKGRVYSSAGVIGFTGAFLLSGARGVLCSLWKVDDEATQALMRKFYELWNPKTGPGLPPADALRAAQASVRAVEKWKHPYFWAAWVLWGAV